MNALNSSYYCRTCCRNIPCLPGEEWKYKCPECYRKEQEAHKQRLEAENMDLKMKNQDLLERLAEAEAAKANIMNEYTELLKKHL